MFRFISHRTHAVQCSRSFNGFGGQRRAALDAGQGLQGLIVVGGHEYFLDRPSPGASRHPLPDSSLRSERFAWERERALLLSVGRCAGAGDEGERPPFQSVLTDFAPLTSPRHSFAGVPDGLSKSLRPDRSLLLAR
jgi:hypothetical protein